MDRIKTYKQLYDYLKDGGDINEKYQPDEETIDDNYSILFFLEEPEAVMLAVENGIDVKYTTDEYKISPLFTVKNPEVLKKLLSLPDIDIHNADSAGQNALFYHTDNLENFNLLMNAGLDINKQDLCGNTCLFVEDIGVHEQLYIIKNFINKIDLNLQEEFNFGLNAFVKTKEALDIIYQYGFQETKFVSPYFINSGFNNKDDLSCWELFSSKKIDIPHNIAFKNLTENEVDFLIRNQYDFDKTKSHEKKDSDSAYSSYYAKNHDYALLYQENKEVIDKIYNAGFNIHVVAGKSGEEYNILSHAYKKREKDLFTYLLFEYNIKSYLQENLIHSEYKEILEQYRVSKEKEQIKQNLENISLKNITQQRL